MCSTNWGSNRGSNTQMHRINTINSLIDFKTYNVNAKVLGYIPDLHFFDLPQSNSCGIYPRAFVPGFIQKQHFWDLSQNKSSGIYPRAKVLGSIPEQQF